MTPTEWAPSASEYTNNNSRAPAPFFNNNGNLSVSEMGTAYEGGSSATNFDKLEIKKLKDDVEHLKT
jgi:hypothetical protein